MAEDNIVFIGRKDTMDYVTAVLTQFKSGSDEVIIRARGKAISRAVDVAEIVRHRFIREAIVKDVRIGTEALVSEQGERTNVSSIEIVLAR
ncbi:MAG: DNA-binding protein Alba [Methanomassiliicoccus sp.]|nr:DNA-binding protein Alba [Methanomassiliicoccus sp.]